MDASKVSGWTVADSKNQPLAKRQLDAVDMSVGEYDGPADRQEFIAPPRVPAVSPREKRKYLCSGLGVSFAWHGIGAIAAYEKQR